MALDLLFVDADDTLWHTVRHFQATERAVYEMLAPLADEVAVRERFEAITDANLRLYGYGARSFTLSMIETVAALGGDTLRSSTIAAILSLGKELLERPVEIFDDVAETLEELSGRTRLVLLTKGDLINQEAKLAGSGLGAYFEGVEVVSDKSPAVFTRLLNRYGVRPEKAGMAGDSIRSDIIPMIEAGGWAAFIRPGASWAHEHAEPPLHHARFSALERFAELRTWVDGIEQHAS